MNAPSSEIKKGLRLLGSDAPQDRLSPSVVEVGRLAPPRAFAVAGVLWHTKGNLACLML